MSPSDRFQIEPITAATGAIITSTALINWLYNLQKVVRTYQHKIQALVTDGQYAWTSNPIYKSWRFASLGTLVYNPTIKQICLTVALYLFTEATAAIEEKELTYHIGQRYKDYMNKVPRWFTNHAIVSYFNKINKTKG